MIFQIDITAIPLNVFSAAAAFISSYAVVRYQIKNLKIAINDLKTANHAIYKEMDTLNSLRQADKDTYFKIREKDQRSIDEKFQNADYKRELLKDKLISKIHDIDKKVSEMHAVIVHKK